MIFIAVTWEEDTRLGRGVVNVRESLSVWTLPMDTIRRGGAATLSVFQMWPTDVERESNLSLVSRGGKGNKDVISVQEEVTPRLLSNKQKAIIDKDKGVCL